MVDYLKDAYEVSIRRACQVAAAPRSSYHYHPRLDRQEHLRGRLKDLAYSRVIYGYRRLHILLQREGWQVNHKRIYRLYTEEGLTLKRRRPKRHKSAVPRNVRIEPKGINDVWTMDFMSDQLADSRRFRILTMLDVYTRENLALIAGQSFRGEDVAAILSRIVEERDTPEYIHCDNGCEFTSKVMDQWAWLNNVRLDFSRPGKPTENAYIESFNGRVRQECLNQHWFTTMDEVQRILDIWRVNYNLERPHSSLGNQSPLEFASSSCKNGKPVNSLNALELTI
jgi:putative transposase